MLKWNNILSTATHGNEKPPKRIEKSEQEWREILTEEEFFVTRQKGTERANSSDMCSLFEPGIYNCRCCKTTLFDANEKFDSHSGWPSFTQPVNNANVAYHVDRSHGMERVETTCNVCDAHLGHVFPDGPEPSGLRFCINAISLEKNK